MDSFQTWGWGDDIVPRHGEGGRQLTHPFKAEAAGLVSMPSQGFKATDVSRVRAKAQMGRNAVILRHKWRSYYEDEIDKEFIIRDIPANQQAAGPECHVAQRAVPATDFRPGY